MTVTYISFYPHYMLGDLKGELKIDDTLFCLMLAMAADPEPIAMVQRDNGKKGKHRRVWEEPETTHLDELIDIIDFGRCVSRNLSKSDKKLQGDLLTFEGEVYALPDMFTGAWADGRGEFDIEVMKKRPAKILRAFARKGYIVSDWEEGSHALALPGYEEAARRAIAKLEAKHYENAIF